MVSVVSTSCGLEFSEVIKKFVLLGQVIAKALQDRRVLDIPFSKAFYKLIPGQELIVYDIYSFDLGLGRALLEFQAVVERKRYLESVCGKNSTLKLDSCFRNTTIEDLCLDFTLPGYPDYVFTSGPDPKLVNMMNLEEYFSFIVDATINAGIYRQVEAFKSGFNQLDLYQLSELVEKAPAKQLQPHQYNSGTFTLSNLGMFGVDRFDVILPPGQIRNFLERCKIWSKNSRT
ncbi:hypothetical protein ACSBR2_032303 [Camellia fascicularis]